MQAAKEIIVVAPEVYTEFARKISHEISKVDGCNGASWTIKQFVDNEFQLGGNRYAIFIGNPDENAMTKDFLPLMSNIKNKAGACFGFDGTKAVAYGEGDLDREKEFRKVISEATLTIGGSTVGAGISAAFIGVFPFFWGFLAFIPLYNYFMKKKRENKLRTEQTKTALTFFMSEHFDQWAKIKK